MPADLGQFFTNLNSRLAEVRMKNQEKLEKFFVDLNPRLETARAEDREQDRKTARRFNSLDYLKTDEIGLSKIMADLLDPKKNHSQGALFLDILLKRINVTAGWPEMDTSNANVYVEKRIKIRDTNGQFIRYRKIDIYIEIPCKGGSYCLAFENKPKADDLEGQLRDYLNYINSHYNGRCLLIYVPSTGTLPSEHSISTDQIKSEKDHFGIMPYYHDQEKIVYDISSFDDEGKLRNDTNRIESGNVTWENFSCGCSVVDWLAACREKCPAKRLYWFLKDAEEYFIKQYGNWTMVNEGESQEISDFVLSDNEHLRTANSIYEEFPNIRLGVFKLFGSALREKVIGELNLHPDLKISSFRETSEEILLFSVYRECWHKYKNAGSFTEGRMSICLGAWTKNPTFDFYWGIYSPYDTEQWPNEEKRRRTWIIDTIEQNSLSLPKGPSDPWLHWNDVDKEYRNGLRLILELHNESKKGGGRIMDYFSDNFVRISNELIPILNQTET